MKAKIFNSVYFTAIFSKIFLVLLSLITSALINRSLGVNLKGEYAYINNIVTIGMVLGSFGLGQTYSTYKRKNGSSYLNLFVSLTIIHALFCIILGIFSFFVSKNLYIYASIILSGFSLLRNNFLYFAAIEDVKKRDFNNIIYKIIYTIAVVVIYLCKIKSLVVMLCLLGLEDIIIAGGILLNYKMKFKFKEIIKFDKSVLKEIYFTGIVSMFMILMMSFNYNADIIVLKYLSSSYSVGLYSVGVQLANMLWLIPDAFKDILFYKTSQKDSVNEIVAVTKLNIYFNIVVIIGFLILGKWFIYIMYGSEFVPAFSVTILLFIGGISMTIYKLIHPLYIAKGKQKMIFVILLISVITNIILNFILIPKYDIIGAAFASVVSYSVCGIVFLIIFCREYSIPFSDFIIIKKGEINMLVEKVKKVRTKC